MKSVYLAGCAMLFAFPSAAWADPDDHDDEAKQVKPETEIVVAARRLDVARANVEPDLGASTYTLSHGVVKLFLVAGLFRSKLWAYPASLVVMGLFVIYQLYRFAYTHGIGLILLTTFDLVVIALVWHEYRLVRHHLPTK